MKIKFLLLGTGLSFIPLTVNAQCVATQDCETLGYTETSCNGGKGVKCPFGNKWACLATEESVCSQNGFKYACSGTGYSGGNGDSCGGKYKKSNCVSGYEWKGESCQKKEILNGPDGDVYKCNGSVVAVKASNMNFYIAMRDLENMLWNDANNANQKYTFCGNLKGNLPTNDQLTTLYRNKSEINNLLSAYGGFPLADDKYWSRDTYQAEYGDGHYYIIMNSGTLISTNISVVGHISRPVLVL